MFTRFLAALASLYLASTPAFADDLQLILSLETLSDGVTEQRVELYASDIDPNTSAVDDRYRLMVNGRTILVPDMLLARLDHERRGYSYDRFTGGISDTPFRRVCKMAGPARGAVLSVRYLTYEDHQIASHAMRPVLSRAENCLFTVRIRPRSDDARAEAIAALATLQTLLDLHGRP